MMDMETCKKCFYSVQMSGGKGHVYCDYLCKTGKRRPKETDGECPVFNPKKKPKVNKKNLDYIFLGGKE